MPGPAIPPLGILQRKTLPGNGQMVCTKRILRRDRVHRCAGPQTLGHNPRLDLIRPATLPIEPNVHPVIPEKLHHSRHRETHAPISIKAEISGQDIKWKVGPATAYDQHKTSVLRFI